jgi:hypothetical protein
LLLEELASHTSDKVDAEAIIAAWNASSAAVRPPVVM